MNVLPDLFAPLAAGAVLFLSMLHAQSPREAAARATVDPALEPLLAKVATARALAAAGKPATLRAEGSYTVVFGEQPEPVAKGAYRELFDGTARARSVTDAGEHGTMEKGVHGELVWELDPHLGAKVQRGSHAAATRRYFAILRGDDPRALYRSIERAASEPGAATGVAPAAGAPIALRMTPAEGRADTWLVETDGTLVRVDIALPAPESAEAAFGMDDLVDARIVFADWRAVGGGRFAFHRTLTMGPATVTTTFTRVEVGAAIPGTQFEPPAAVAKVQPAPSQPAFDAAGKPIHQIVERTAQPTASIRVKVAPAELSKQLGVLLPEVHAHLVAAGGRPAGPPFSRYHAFSETEIDLEAGFPVQAPVEAKGRVASGELPGGRAVVGWHVGPYDQLTRAHTALQAFLTAQKLTARGGPWEVYWTDPGMVPDQAKWRTQIFQAIE